MGDLRMTTWVEKLHVEMTPEDWARQAHQQDCTCMDTENIDRANCRKCLAEDFHAAMDAERERIAKLIESRAWETISMGATCEALAKQIRGINAPTREGE
jgi:hypothetical protein